MSQKRLVPQWRERMYNGLLREKETMLVCLIAVFLWGLAAHGYGFLHRNLSHDGLNVFVAGEWEETWKIMLGRYFVPAYRAVFRGPIMLPWLIGLWGLFWTAVAAYMVVRLLEVRSKFQMVLICGVLVTNITYISQIATYLYEFDFNGFAIVLAVGAVCLWRYRPGLGCCALGAVCVMLSIGIYQSFVAVAVTLIIWISIMDLLREKPVKMVFQNGLWGIGMLVLGGVLYWLVGTVVHAVTGIGLEARTDALAVADGESFLSQYVRLIVPAIVDLGGNIVHPAYCRVPQIGLILGILALLAVLCVRICRRKKFTWDRIALIAILCLALPFGMNCVYFLAKGEGMHDLTTYATWYFYIILLQLAFWVYENAGKPSPAANLTAIAACVLVVWVLGQNVTLANTAYVKKKMDADGTFSTMTRVIAMLEQQEGYEPGETKIAMVGVPLNTASRPAFDNVKTITGLVGDISVSSDVIAWNYNAYDSYFRYVMNYPVVMCGEEERVEKVLSSPQVAEMPAFPKAGCMEMVNGILVIKLSE